MALKDLQTVLTNEHLIIAVIILYVLWFIAALAWLLVTKHGDENDET